MRKQFVYVSIYNDLYLFFSYLIEHQVCYLILCEKSFSKRLAFSFLEDLQNEFINQYGHKINSITRPYSFIEFGILKFIINHFFHIDFSHIDFFHIDFFQTDNYIQKAKKSFMDARARRNLNQLNTELQDVQKIMVQNIDDVLQRGLAISGKISFIVID